MSLVRLIYASTLKDTGTPSIVTDIIKTSAVHNDKAAVTGLLVFGNEQFLQLIEGSPDAVNELYCRIVRDDRHKHVVLIDYSEISAREFDRWSMKLILLTKEKLALLFRFSATEDFERPRPESGGNIRRESGMGARARYSYAA